MKPIIAAFFVAVLFVVGPTAEASPLRQTSSYVVRAGDTLSSIAGRYGTSVSALKQANGLVNDRIYVGQSLSIPVQSGQSSVAGAGTNSQASPAVSYSASSCALSYAVQRGDTLSAIAARCGTSVSALRAVNGLSGTGIWAGQRLSIPGATGSQVVAARSTSGAAPRTVHPAPTPAPAFPAWLYSLD